MILGWLVEADAQLDRAKNESTTPAEDRIIDTLDAILRHLFGEARPGPALIQSSETATPCGSAPLTSVSSVSSAEAEYERLQAKIRNEN